MATETQKFGLSKIGQIAIAVRDLERSAAFYREQLGLRFLFEVPGKMSFFDCDGTWLMLSLPEGEAFDHPGSVLYFSVEDIGRAYEVLSARGVEFLSPPHRIADMGAYELWMAFFRDAERTVLALRSEVPK